MTLQNLTGKKKKQSGSLDRDAFIQRAFEKARREDSCPPPGERTPTTTRNLRSEWRFDYFPRNVSSPKQFGAASEERAKPKEAQEGGTGRRHDLRQGGTQEAAPDPHRVFVGAYHAGVARQ